jgi:branched-chain amino acid transport system permease protein
LAGRGMAEAARPSARPIAGRGAFAAAARTPLAALAVLVVLLLLPLALNEFLLGIVILILFWSYLGTAWNILGGYAGQFSFGHAAFFGIGAYTSTWLRVAHGVNPWIGMLLGGALAMGFGLFTGFLTGRYGIRGPYFALATFAFAEMLRLLANGLDVINGPRGLQIPLIGGDSWLAFQFEEVRRPYYYVILAFLAAGILVTYLLSRSKAGYYLQAIREDEDAAAALGVHTLRYKLGATGISAFLTALGGTFYAQYLLFIDPGLVFGAHVSVEILLRPLLGGVGTVLGPLVGGVVLTPLSEFTRALLRTPPPFLEALRGRAGVDVMLFGAILMLVILFLPEGIVGWIRQRARRFRRPAGR